MKKWIVSLSMAALAIPLTSCTTATMVYVRKQRNDNAYLIQRTREQVRSCLGKAKAHHKVDGIEVWQYNYVPKGHHHACVIKVFFKGRYSNKSEFNRIGVVAQSQGVGTCMAAKNEIKPCLKRYLVMTK